MTLAFLGDIDADRVPKIAYRLDETAGGLPAFSLCAKGVGAFPHFKRARVLWVGLHGDLSCLQDLYQATWKTIEPLGFEPEKRPFRAHLTIGRARGKGNARAPGKLPEAMQAPSDAFDVNEVHLYQSVLKPTGAHYRLLHTSFLGS